MKAIQNKQQNQSVSQEIINYRKAVDNCINLASKNADVEAQAFIDRTFKSEGTKREVIKHTYDEYHTKAFHKEMNRLTQEVGIRFVEYHDHI